MNTAPDDDLAEYYRQAETWAADRELAAVGSRRMAWIGIGVLATIAILEAVAIVLLLPLKTVVPYTLLVDKQTGSVQALKPLEREMIAPDRALVRSFLAQYVIARESFDADSVKATYNKVALWSAGEARRQYIAGMQATNPASPLASLPRRTQIAVEIRSLTSLAADTALVRYSTIRTDFGGQPQPAQTWVAAIRYRFSGEAMADVDRLINPLGFQVTRFRRDAEFIPEPPPIAAAPTPMPRGTLPMRTEAPQ